MQKAITSLQRRVRDVATVLNSIGAIVLLLMVCVGVIGVLSRYFIGQPLSWTDEIITYLIPLFVALCAGDLLIQNKHISIDILPPLRYVTEFSLFAVSVALLISGSKMVIFAFEFGLYVPGSLGLRAWLVAICLPLGAAFMTLITGLNLVSVVTAPHGVKDDVGQRHNH